MYNNFFVSYTDGIKSLVMNNPLSLNLLALDRISSFTVRLIHSTIKDLSYLVCLTFPNSKKNSKICEFTVHINGIFNYIQKAFDITQSVSFTSNTLIYYIIFFWFLLDSFQCFSRGLRIGATCKNLTTEPTEHWESRLQQHKKTAGGE